MKHYRFFYHYNKPNKKMSVHFRGACSTVENIVCHVPCETKWSKTQPHLKMIGWASEVKIYDKTAHILP